jgi:hypothetical protein
MSGSDQMIDNVRRGRISATAAEPFIAYGALDYAYRVMDTAVTGTSQ